MADSLREIEREREREEEIYIERGRERGIERAVGGWNRELEERERESAL
jgi:hypothetical protein